MTTPQFNPSTPPPMNDQNQNAPDSRHEKINSIWKIVSLVYALAAIGLVIYWEFDDSGLSMTVREWQASIFDGSYYVKLNFLITLIILLAPLLIGKVIVEKVTGVKLENARSWRRR